MAAYELLLLNTAIPQIQAAQSGDTYVVPRDIAFSTVANLANGTNLLPSLTFSSDTNTGIYREGADALGFTAGGGTNQMVLTSTGLGVGTNNPAYKLDVAGIIRSNTGIKSITASGGQPEFVLDQSGVASWTIYNPPSNTALRFYNGVDRMTLDSSGNLGLGVTPSAWSGAGKIIQFGNGNASIGTQNNGDANFLHNAYESPAGTFKYASSNPALRYQLDINNNAHKWYTAPSGFGYGTAATSLTATQNGNSYTIVTAGTTDFTLIGAANNNVGTTFTKSGGTGAGTGTVSQNISFTQAMTLDASGNLGIGAAPNDNRLNIGGISNYRGIGLTTSTASARCTITFVNTNTNTYGSYIQDSSAGDLCFGRVNADYGGHAERARITSGGYFKASNTGTYIGSTSLFHELVSDQDNNIVRMQNSNASPNGIDINFSGGAPDNNTAYFLQARDNASGGTTRCIIYSDGDLANHDGVYGTISDQKLKQDIVDAGSQWADIKAIRFRKYRMKSDVAVNPDAPALLGVVAQELEQVSPGLVDEHPDMETVEVTDEDGNVTQTQQPTGTTTKTVKSSILLMKAAVALQEAMARIEKLEAEVAALKGA